MPFPRLRVRRCFCASASTYRLISGTVSHALVRGNDDQMSDGADSTVRGLELVGVCVAAPPPAGSSVVPGEEDDNGPVSPYAWEPVGVWLCCPSQGLTVCAGSVWVGSGSWCTNTRVGRGWCVSQGKTGLGFSLGLAGGSLGTSYHMFLGGVGYRSGGTNGAVSEDMA